MGYEINETHDPNLQSWVESANDPNTDFPIQNLPLCVVNATDDLPDETKLHDIARNDPSITIATFGVVVGDRVLQLNQISNKLATVINGLTLHGFGVRVTPDGVATCPEQILSHIVTYWAQVRQQLVHWLRTDGNNWLRQNSELRPHLFRPISETTLYPIYARDYTDFYASLYHATNVGSMFRPDNPLLPNYKHIPIGYHGRASSIVISGTDVRRPNGQLLPGATVEDGDPVFGPCKMLDYELEMGAIVGRGNALGEPVSIENAEDHILGLCILNDWSARDMQKWEYQPLGPFLAKNFASTVSPYIVTMEALAPFRCPAQERDASDPTPLPYLTSDANTRAGGFDITLEVFIQSEQMRQKNIKPMRISRGNFKDMYWTVAQMLAHHTSNGCNLQPGDMLGSGTISGPTRDARGCMLELTWDGDPWAKEPKLVPGSQRTPITLPTGEERKFLADGDQIIMRAFCERDGFRRIGFGECRGKILPASA
ncbi:MAG: fumarylacetoacetase [Phycisphaeraceae bacterium]|nr:fumarylacetoacetase [Phycisphaerales bacterium]MCB9861513.1 fumarylacetoacetase [Phycisphaeraceae bacterium]